MLTVNEIEDLSQAVSPVVALGVDKTGQLIGPVDQIPEAWKERIGAFVANVEWQPKPGAARFVDGISDGPVLLLIGMPDRAEFGLEDIRKAGAAAVSRCQNRTSLALALGATSAEMVAAVEGALLGSYRFVDFKGSLFTQPAPALTAIETLVPNPTDGAATWTVAKATAACGAAMKARDWVNTDGATLSPEVFATQATALLEDAGITVEVWDEDRLRVEKCGGILGVGQGSSRPPRLLIASYEPDDAVGSVTLVGKGVTFDSGGLSLKSGDGMMTMKCDMGGAAAVIAALSVVPLVAPRLSVRAVVPMAENLPGGTAIRPGDVLTMRSGVTVEVLNTDAEGRLILADALTVASEANPDLIIDLATLTGACVVALGPDIAGVMETRPAAARDLLRIGEETGEGLWQLPLPAPYKKFLESSVADLRNIGTNRNGGTLTAGLFLSNFVGDRPWTHIDIAGPAFVEKGSGYLAAGGTGFGVRTLARALSDWSSQGSLPADVG
jgi:leucyl aminopeptidase